VLEVANTMATVTPNVRCAPVGTVDEEGFAAPTPCKTEALLKSVVRGNIVEGVNDVEGGCDAEFIIEE
jgi:hypothetical protein